MSQNHVPIGKVKRDISQLVNRVAYGGERIVLTSRGKPKAALVSLEDYERLQQEQAGEKLARFQAWLDETNALAAKVLARRAGEPIDVDALRQQERQEMEGRDGWIAGRAGRD